MYVAYAYTHVYIYINIGQSLHIPTHMPSITWGGGGGVLAVEDLLWG